MGAMNEADNINAAFPQKLHFLFQPARYKVLYGGRGGAKSHSVARALLLQGTQQPLRILCAREFQSSISESVHHLLQSQISLLNLGDFYEIQNSLIKGLNGSEFVFAGLRNNVTKIKSFEGVDRVWVEEAQAVSKSSWEVLIPTIRKDDSEIWLTFNPELETDETYQRFVVRPPEGAVVEKINWTDNPWFPATLERERLQLKERDPDAYQNVWEGNCRVSLEGAIYAKELRQAKEEGRIRSVPYDAAKQVHTFWDLGWADKTSIWFSQSVGPELRLIDYYENSQMPLQHYIQVMQSKGYIYGRDWLPHDAKAKSLQTGRSVEEILLSMGRQVSITPNLSIFDGINAARTVFNRCFFDEQKCADGLQSLRHYRYDVDPESKQLSGRPLHDWACFVAGTLIETEHGHTPIDGLSVGDKVFTPAGFRKVLNVYVYTATELIEIATADGRKVICTPEHKFFTATGMVGADALYYGCNLYTGREASWRLISLILRVVGITDIHAVITDITQQRSNDAKALNTDSYIVTCGKTLMGLSQKIAKSITKTAIQAITLSRTLSAFPEAPTSPCMARNLASDPHLGISQMRESNFIPCTRSEYGKTGKRCSLSPENRSLALQKQQKNGTQAIRAKNGTRHTPSNHGKIGRLSTKFVRFAVKNLLRFGNERCTAGRIVGLRQLEGVKQPVYDLTVEDDHCYVANGILTSNSHGSDAFRYFALSIGEDAPVASARGIKISGWRA